MTSDATSLWLVVPAGETAAGGWIDDTLRERAAETGQLGRTPLAGQFPRQRVEVVTGPGSADRAQRLYQLRGWTDGLPIVPPTTARVREMLTFTDRKPAELLRRGRAAEGPRHDREDRGQCRHGRLPGRLFSRRAGRR